MQGAVKKSGQPTVRLGDRLLDSGIITEDQLKIALLEQKTLQKPLFRESPCLTWKKIQNTAYILHEYLGTRYVHTTKTY